MLKVLDTLFQITPTLSPKLKNVAKLILDKPNAVATTSMRALAKQAGVTPPTMIRLAKELGFEYSRETYIRGDGSIVLMVEILPEFLLIVMMEMNSLKVDFFDCDQYITTIDDLVQSLIDIIDQDPNDQ